MKELDDLIFALRVKGILDETDKVGSLDLVVALKKIAAEVEGHQTEAGPFLAYFEIQSDHRENDGRSWVDYCDLHLLAYRQVSRKLELMLIRSNATLFVKGYYFGSTSYTKYRTELKGFGEKDYLQVYEGEVKPAVYGGERCQIFEVHLGETRVLNDQIKPLHSMVFSMEVTFS